MSRRRRVLGAVSAFVPTRRMALATALLAPLWLLSWWSTGLAMAAAVTVALVLAVAADIALLPDARDLEVRRDAPRTLGVGDAEGGRYVVRSHWGRLLHVTLFDAMPEERV